MFNFFRLLSILFLVCLTNVCQTFGNKREGSNQPLILVSTVDGKVSALEVKEGKVLWSNNFGSTPLVSSSLTPLYYNQDGKDIEIVPSLNGGLFKLQGESLQQIPFNADDMLEKSHQLTATSQLVGGKEYSSLGIDAATGRMLYNCSASGCNQTKGGSKVYGDVIVVKRNQLTIRLVETRSGSEKWNFKVGEVNLDFSKGLEKSLIGYQPQGYQADLRSSFDDKKEDYLCEEEGKSWRREDKERIKFSLTDRTVMLLSATDKSSFEWKRKFDSHITSAWVLVQGLLLNLDLFSPLTSPVPTTDQPVPLTSNQFSIFHGHFFGKSFVQLSTGMKEVFRISASNQQQQVSSSTGLVEYAPQPLKIYTKSGRPSKSTITNDWLHAMDSVDEANSDQDESSNTQVQIYDRPKFTEDRLFFGDFNECSRIVEGGKNDQQQQQSDEEALGDRRDPSDVGILNSSSISGEIGESDNSLFEFLRSVFTFPQFICTLAATLALVYKIYPRVVDMFLRLVSDQNGGENAGGSTGTGEGSSSGAIRNEATAVIGKIPTFVNGAVGSGDLSKATDECHQINEKDFESRFLHDFEVLECLGKGGFGVVFKARNKMDNCEYAVKRILLPESKRAREKMLREVRALAKIGHHPSIVRYFTCWEESPPSGWQEEKDEQLKAQLNWQVSSCGGEEDDETYTRTTNQQQQSSSIVYRRQSSIQSQLKLRIPVSASSAGGDFSMRIETDSELSPTSPYLVPPMLPLESHNSEFSSSYNPVGFSDDDEDSTSSESDATTKRRWSRYDEDSSSMGIIFDSKAYDMEQQLSNVLQDDKDDDIEIFSRQKSSTTSGSTDENWKGMRKRSQSECRTWTRNDDLPTAEKSHRLQIPTVDDKLTTADKKKKSHRRTSSYNQVLSQMMSQQQGKERRHRRRRRNRNSSTCSTTQVYLYIQMQLCKRESLRDWLETNNRHRDHTQCLTIFKQVTDAVAFIHGNNLIHRDLKPSNVFISFEGEVRVGDFGLVTHSKDGNKLLDVSFTPLRRQSTLAMTTSSRGVTGLTHTQQVGTQLYMAPEQMTSKRYSDKVDIFALGLILFELSHAFDTQMERIKLLNEARYGKFPSNFTDNFPHEAELVEAMLHIDEHRRPSAVQIQACHLLTNLK